MSYLQNLVGRIRYWLPVESDIPFDFVVFVVPLAVIMEALTDFVVLNRKIVAILNFVTWLKGWMSTTMVDFVVAVVVAVVVVVVVDSSMVLMTSHSMSEFWCCCCFCCYCCYWWWWC